MLGRQDILDVLLKECEITKHLATKIPAGGSDYRQSPDQRTTLEILQYLSMCGLGGSYAMADGNWDRYSELSEAAKKVTLDGIDAAMDEQAAKLRTFYGEMTDEAFSTQEAKTPLGDVMTLGRALLDLPVRWMAAYRMQLFANCKGAGNSDIWTPNCWGGIDMDRPPAS